MSTAMPALIVCLVVWVYIIYAIKKRKKEKKALPHPPTSHEYTCPYCGNHSSTFLAYNACSECYREWGPGAPERAQIDAECAIIDRSPELARLLDVVQACLDKSPARGGWIIWDNNNVLEFYRDGGYEPVASLSMWANIQTHGGRLHFFQCCIDAFRQSYPQYRFGFMDKGLYWEQ